MISDIAMIIIMSFMFMISRVKGSYYYRIMILFNLKLINFNLNFHLKIYAR